MLIKNIEMISFGKFKNKTIEFKEGLNIVVGDNECGKSTIISFIYAMIYGFGDSRGKGLSLREKYVPWDAGCCEGKMTFVTDSNETVTVYRKSGSVKKYDICHIYNTLTGEEINSSAESFLGINSDTFFKTICMQQQSCTFYGGNDEITRKLSNIASVGDENLSFEKAKKILENSRREILPLRGEGGKLAEVSEKIFRLEQQKAISDCALTEIASAKKLLCEKRNALSVLEKEYEVLSGKNYSSQISHLMGRIEERGNYSLQDKSRPGKKYIFLFSSIIFLVLFITLIIAGNPLYLIPLIMFLGSIAAFFIKGRKESVTENIVSDDLTAKLEKLKVEEKIHTEKLATLKAKISDTEKSIAQLESTAKLKQGLVNEKIDAELCALYSKKRILEKNLDALKAALCALDKASENMKNDFTPAINSLASKYFKALCNDKYAGLFCNEDFDIKVDFTLPRSSSFFSGGCVDQMYFALRLALTDMLFKEKSVFMLLDQPFIQYDGKRRENALRLLETLPENRQIILFENYVERFSRNKNTEILT